MENQPEVLEKSSVSLHCRLHSAAVFGAALLVSASLLAPSAMAAEDPQYGGIMTVVTSKGPPNYDPVGNTSSSILNFAGPIYNALVVWDPQNPNEIIGDLAETWELSPDGLTYTFHLVKNAMFHDGVPLTSADVKATFDFVRNPPEGVVSSRKKTLAAIADIDTPDDYTVRFNLSRPNPALLASLAAGWMIVAPKHILDEAGDLKDNVIGSGPFMFKEIKRGVSYEFVRNPNYHVEGRPYMDGITFFIVPERGTRYAYVRTGQADILSGVQGGNARRAMTELADSVVVHRVVGLTGDPYTINSLREPFGDIRVRKALALSIDRDESVIVVNEGDGRIAGLLPTQPWGMPASEIEKIPGYGKDVEANRAEAKRLLAEAGYPDGFETTIIGRKGAGTHDERMIFLADQFGKIGVKVKLIPMDTAQYFEEAAVRNFDIATNVVSVGANDPDFYFGPYHTCDGSQNWTGLCSPELDALFLEQSQTVDPIERKKLVAEMEKLGLGLFGTDVLYFKVKFMMTNKRVRNFVSHPEGDNNRRYQDVWLSGS